MSETSQVDSLVRASFTVKDYYARDETGSSEYRVVYDERTRASFRGLCQKLSPLGFTPQLVGTEDDAALIVLPTPELPKSRARTPVFLAAISVVSIIATGWGMGIVNAQAAGESVLLTAASFALAVAAVLLARDLAHRLLAQRKGMSTLQYYLPNIPLFVPIPVLYYLPAFGSITFLRRPMLDRDSLFDFYFVGAVAGAAAALAVALIGASNAVVLAAAQSGTLNSNLSLLQTFALAVGGNGLSVVPPPGQEALLSPVEIAAWVGFLIVFFNLVPAALFDGGRMSTLILGERGSKATTMIAAALVAVIDMPNYWVLFLLIFLLAAVQPSNETLDAVTKISRSRKLLFLVAMAILFLCIPVPQTILTFPL